MMSHLEILSLGSSMLYYVLVVPMLYIASWISSYCCPVSSISYIMLTFALFLLELMLVIWLVVFNATHPDFIAHMASGTISVSQPKQHSHYPQPR